MYFLNRKMGAAEALGCNLVSGVFKQEELMPEVMRMAKEMAAASPLALKRIKQNLNNADEIMSFSAALDGEAERHARTAFHPNAQEAGAAFVQKEARFSSPAQAKPVGSFQALI